MPSPWTRRLVREYPPREVCPGTGTVITGPKCRACGQVVYHDQRDLTYPTHLRETSSR
jgi:hypothetical protein